MIYTVFTLSSPNNLDDVRFIGITTQTVTKRLCDIISVAKKDYCPGHNSMLSVWLREVLETGKMPEVNEVLSTYDKEDATACRTSTFNSLFSTGRLLHSISGKNVGRKLRQVINSTNSTPGRQPDENTKSAKYSLNRKQVQRGEAELILRPYL